MRLLLAGVLVLAGCSGGGEEPRTWPSGTRSLYTDMASELVPSWSDGRLADEAQHVCGALDEQPDTTGWVELVAHYKSLGVQPREAGGLITYAVGTLCREHLPVLPST